MPRGGAFLRHPATPRHPENVQVYELRREQWIPRPPAEVFHFFSDAANLEAVTPPWLQFRILTPSVELRAGARIEYSLKVRGLPLRWLTGIEVWDPPNCFVDNQIAGPYRLWRHAHSFVEERGGTRMFDEVRYALPFGPVGQLAHAFLVRRDIAQIFDYRRKRICELAGSWERAGAA